MPTRRAARRRLTLAAMSAALAIVAPTFAQVLAPPVAADASAGEETLAGVFVRDSAIAGDKLALAERMAKAAEWDTAADVYQEVLDRFADRLVPTHATATGVADRFGSVSGVVQDRLAAWPAAGLEVYLTRHGAAARTLLDGASGPDDRATLARVVARYFVTDAGRDAAVRLVELGFDDAEFAASATLADRLIDHHPNLTADGASLAPLLLTRAALAWHFANEPARADADAKRLASDYPDARARLGGAERGLATFVAGELAKPAPRPIATLAADSWPQPFGSADHAAVAAEANAKAPHEWARILSFPVDAARPQTGQPPTDPQTLAMLQQQRTAGITTGILPAVDRGRLYFSDNATLTARDLSTGEPPPAWTANYPNDDGRFRVAGAPPTPRGAQMSVTLSGDRVLAILGQSDQLVADNGMVFRRRIGNGGGGGGNRAGNDNAITGARVVCLDRESGRLLWQASPDGLPIDAKPNDAADADAPKPDAGDVEANVPRKVPDVAPPAKRVDPDAAAIRASDPCGSVLVVNDSVYVVTRGLRGGGFQDVFLCCYALADGAPRWARHLASGNAPTPDEDRVPSGANSHLAYADGRVFVSTDLGALACVDAADGAIAWLAFYPRPKPSSIPPWMARQQGAGAQRVTPAFAGNPVIVRDGKVLTLPGDADALFVHDAATGRCVAQVGTERQLDATRSERLDVLAGLVGDRLVMASGFAISVLDWAKLTAPAPTDAATTQPAEPPTRVARVEDVLVNRTPVLSPDHPGERTISGRPFVTDSSVYVPVAWRLLRFDANARRVLDQYPAGDEPLDARPDESAGNVVAVDGMLVVAGPQRVSVYAELARLRTRLDAAIAAAPGDVGPRLTYARAMFDTGRLDETLTWLDGAIAQLASNDATTRPATDRDAVFNACLAMLRRTLALPGDADAKTFATKVIDRLDRSAATPAQQVTTRLAAAWQAGRARDVAGAIAAYQSLLDDATLGAVRVSADESASAVAVAPSSDGDADAAPATPPADDTNGGVPAARLARAAIDKLIAAPGGRAAYAAVEARAADALDAERKRLEADPAGGAGLGGLIAVAERFPNSSAARDAMSLGVSWIARGTSSVDLRRLGARLDEADVKSRAALDATQLRLALARGDVDAALGRARRLATLDATTAIDVGGAPMTPASAVAKLQADAYASAEQRLPDLHADFAGHAFADGAGVTVTNVAAILVPARGLPRNDRLVAIMRSDGPRRLNVYAAGATTPLCSVDVPGLIDSATSEWSGDRLVLAQPGRVVCVDVAANRVAWTREATSIDGGDRPDVALARASITVPAVLLEPTTAPPAAAVDGAPARGEDEAARAVRRADERLVAARNDPAVRIALQQRNLALQRQMLIAARANRMNVIVENGGDGTGVADPILDPGAPETFGTVGIAAGRVVATTSRGRVVGLDLADGSTRWSARPGDRPATSVAIGFDHVAVAGTDERTSRVVVFDADDGREVAREQYSPDPRGRVANVAISPEGWLAVIRGEGVTTWDLAEGAAAPLGTSDGASNNNPSGVMTFAQSGGPGHVAFAGDKLLVAAELGTPTQHVRVIDVATAKPMRAVDPQTRQQVEQRLIPRYARDRRTGEEPLSIVMHNGRALLSTGQAMVSMSVGEGNASTWTRTLPDQPTRLSRQSPVLVRGGVVVLGWPADLVDASSGPTETSPTVMFELYSRETLENGREVGMVVDEVRLGDAGEPKRRGGKRTSSGPRILDRFACVDGGFYLVTNSGTLTFLRGAK